MGGITKIPDTSLKIPSELAVYAASGTGLTVTVGHGYVAGVAYTGADVSTNIQDVANIASPSGWTNLVSLSGSKMIVTVQGLNIGSGADGSFVHISIDENEDAGEDIRAQVLVDGVIIGDITVTRDASGNISNSFLGYKQFSSYSGGTVFECNNSFVIRGCCEGNNFADAGTTFKMGAVHYIKVA